jgi:hypothetical protein
MRWLGIQAKGVKLQASQQGKPLGPSLQQGVMHAGMGISINL